MTDRIGERALQKPLFGGATQLRPSREVPRQVLEHRVKPRDLSAYQNDRAAEHRSSSDLWVVLLRADQTVGVGAWDVVGRFWLPRCPSVGRSNQYWLCSVDLRRP